MSKSIKKIVYIAMLSAVAVALMYFEFPIPFIPPFYKIDLSDVPAVIGGFILGPVAGVSIEAIKVILHGLTKGTESAWVGEIANFIIGSVFIIPSAIIYKKNKTKKSAVLGMTIGCLLMALVGIVVNVYILLPMYAKLFLGSIENIIEVSNKANPYINGIWSLAILAVVPFNIIKGIIISIITFLLYKTVRKVIK